MFKKITNRLNQVAQEKGLEIETYPHDSFLSVNIKKGEKEDKFLICRDRRSGDLRWISGLSNTVRKPLQGMFDKIWREY